MLKTVNIPGAQRLPCLYRVDTKHSVLNIFLSLPFRHVLDQRFEKSASTFVANFVSDQLADGRRFRILTIVDDCIRECLALVADTSLSGVRVARGANDRAIRSLARHRRRPSDTNSLIRQLEPCS